MLDWWYWKISYWLVFIDIIIGEYIALNKWVAKLNLGIKQSKFNISIKWGNKWKWTTKLKWFKNYVDRRYFIKYDFLIKNAIKFDKWSSWSFQNW